MLCWVRARERRLLPPPGSQTLPLGKLIRNVNRKDGKEVSNDRDAGQREFVPRGESLSFPTDGLSWGHGVAGVFDRKKERLGESTRRRFEGRCFSR